MIHKTYVMIFLGLQFCDESNSQIYNDPAGKSFKIINDVLSEMSSLFKDKIFHIGADETSVTNNCTLNLTSSFENKLLKSIKTNLKKTPAGWEEVLFNSKAATNVTTVNTWYQYKAADVIATGRQAIESRSAWFYFTGPG